jgi:multidrug efflux pump subunit AcrA (membrane-fusion protein)
MAEDSNKFPDPSHELPPPAGARPEMQGEQPALRTPEGHELGAGFERVPGPKNRKVLYLLAGGAVLLLLVIFALGWVPLHARNKEIRQDAAERARADPVVETAVVKRGAADGGWVVPGNAVAIRNGQSVVFTVAGNRVHMVPVARGRDDGPAIEVLSGLRDGDVVVTHVTDEVYEGATVRAHPAPSPQTGDNDLSNGRTSKSGANTGSRP